MKLIVAVVLLICASVAFGYPSEQKGWMVPRVDGSFEWVSEAKWASVMAGDSKSTAEDIAASVKFYLYTLNNTNPQPIDVATANSLKSTYFNSANPTRILIHGFQNNYQSPINVLVRNAILSKGAFNVISVDWSKYAGSYDYKLAAQRQQEVGKQVAKLIDYLNQNGGMSFSTLGVIGHSLGAHVAGNAGKNVSRGRIAYIVGLDPAWPLFSYENTANRLYTSDANYVETIQTCGGRLGFLKPVGTTAFYPNGGKSQPGCGEDLTGSCSHSRSYEYYAESIQRQSFPSVRCAEYGAAVNNQCGNTFSDVRLGSPDYTGIHSGVFYTPVNDKAPFGKA